jgi:ATP-dependent RNA helicase DeaD
MTFDELPLPPALAQALIARGYQTPTGVQAAVLDPAVAGRDLLVTSQTGSGKTIAFGAALAQTLLAPEAAAPSPRARRTAPAALVIVPTRELATQVRGELAWLLAGTGLRLASFTGGTPVGGDLRALERGVDVVIGTPGRLVDLLRRERLPLASLAVVVLDEADEMLDLGFREDLETILGAAPAERRTLLLSATLPPEIRALARKYQRDAATLDTRAAAGAGAAHQDIVYRAHLVAAGDRRAAVVNVLRAEGGRAIVFCTTREGVAELHAALLARGFAAAAISGERAQAERDRALDQLRRGDARVLVATNVAARGLDLPDVDLIIHADLPLNAESLAHRSGRTGRAGRKGTAVVLATPAERRKAERLLGSVHVRAVWTPPPTPEAIAAAARERLAAELLAGRPAAGSAAGGTDEAGPEAGGGGAPSADAQALARRLEAALGAPVLIQRLLAREQARLPAGEPLRAIAAPAELDRHDHRAAPRGRGELSRDAALFRVNLGAADNADPRWLLPLICRRGGVTRRDVGAIRIGPRETTFEISGSAARDFAEAAAETDPRARHVVITRAGVPSRSTSPARPALPPRPASDAPPPPAAAPARATPPPPRFAGPPPHAARPRRDGFAPFAPRRSRPAPFSGGGAPARPNGQAKPPEAPRSHTPPAAARPHASNGPKPHPHPKPAPGGRPAHGKRPRRKG